METRQNNKFWEYIWMHGKKKCHCCIGCKSEIIYFIWWEWLCKRIRFCVNYRLKIYKLLSWKIILPINLSKNRSIFRIHLIIVSDHDHMPKSCQPIEQQTYPHCTMMNTMGIVTEAKLLDVEAIPVHNLLESHSVTTFMPEEEASICPLLSSNTNGVITPLAFSHPLTICNNHELDESNSSSNLCRLGGNKTDSCSSSGSSSSLAMNVSEDVSANLFNKHNSYKHLQPNNTFIMEVIIVIFVQSAFIL